MTMFSGKGPIDYIGHLMSVEDWIDCVDGGAFIDYDGYGHPSDGKTIDGSINVHPSEGLTKVPFGTTHIMWYNR